MDLGVLIIGVLVPFLYPILLSIGKYILETEPSKISFNTRAIFLYSIALGVMTLSVIVFWAYSFDSGYSYFASFMVSCVWILIIYRFRLKRSPEDLVSGLPFLFSVYSFITISLWVQFSGLDALYWGGWVTLVTATFIVTTYIGELATARR